MRSLLPTSADSLTFDQLVRAYAYPDPDPQSPRRPWIRGNMVATVDGAVTDESDRSGSISTPADQGVFSTLRGLADVVLVGAGTVRMEGYGPAQARAEYAELRLGQGQHPAPTIAVVSNRLSFDPASTLFTQAEQPTIIFTSAASPPQARRKLESVADVRVVGDQSVDLRQLAEVFAEKEQYRVLCEGGPKLLAELATAGLLDELCLTVTPLLVGGESTRILNGITIRRRLALAHVLEEDGSLFTRWTDAGVDARRG